MPRTINPVKKLARAEKKLSIKYTELRKIQAEVRAAQREIKGRTPHTISFSAQLRNAVATSSGSFTSRSITIKILGKDAPTAKVRQAAVVLLKMAEDGKVNRTMSADQPRGQMIYTKAN